VIRNDAMEQIYIIEILQMACSTGTNASNLFVTNIKARD
jgi:hypothetical protein